jgi:hypothetical protein
MQLDYSTGSLEITIRDDEKGRGQDGSLPCYNGEEQI